MSYNFKEIVDFKILKIHVIPCIERLEKYHILKRWHIYQDNQKEFHFQKVYSSLLRNASFSENQKTSFGSKLFCNKKIKNLMKIYSIFIGNVPFFFLSYYSMWRTTWIFIIIFKKNYRTSLFASDNEIKTWAKKYCHLKVGTISWSYFWTIRSKSNK
jgi:hypothetical protein